MLFLLLDDGGVKHICEEEEKKSGVILAAPCVSRRGDV